MSDSGTSGKSRGITRLSQVIADARIESEGGFAPSLDNPTRPKTPAGFDDRLADPKLNILNMKAAASSRRRDIGGTRNIHKRLLDNMENSKPRTLSSKARSSSPVVMATSSAYLSKIPDLPFDTDKISQDLDDIDNDLDSFSFSSFNLMLGEQIVKFTKFLEGLQPDAELDTGKL